MPTMQPLSDGAKIQLEPTSTVFCRVVTKAALDIDNQTQAITLRMATLFPCEGPTEDYRIPAETTWTTLVLVEAMGRFRAHHTVALTDQIHRFAELHAATQWNIVEHSFSTAVDERTELTEIRRAERGNAVAKVKKVLSYVVGLVNYYEQRVTSPSHRRAASSKLIQEVFAKGLQELRDHWLAPSTGRLVGHLAGMRALDVSQLPFGSAVKKTLLADLLRPLDDLLQPRDRMLRAGWVGYSKVSSAMSAAVASIFTAVTTDISEGNYAEVKRFLDSCDRSDAEQARWLSGVAKALTALVHDKVTAAKAVTQRTELAHPAVKSDVDALTGEYTALCALRDTLHTYLDPPLREVLDQGIMGVRRTATAEASQHFEIAATAASQGRFAECERSLQLLECLLVGSFHTCSEAMVWDGVAASDCSTVRAKVVAYVSAARESYDAAFLRVIYWLTDNSCKLSEDSVAVLRDALATSPPRAVISNLEHAADIAAKTKGTSDKAAVFYAAQAEALIAHLSKQIFNVLGVLKQSLCSSEQRLALLKLPQLSASCLSEAIWANVGTAILEQIDRCNLDNSTVGNEEDGTAAAASANAQETVGTTVSVEGYQTSKAIEGRTAKGWLTTMQVYLTNDSTVASSL
jgi:hypothetical protein